MTTNEEFIARSLRALQTQINDQEKDLREMRVRISLLEETNHWNAGLGNIAYSPEREMVSKSADGRLHYYHNAENCQRPIEEVNDGATD